MYGENTAPIPAQAGTTPQTPSHRNHHTTTLFHHEPRQHQPRNVNMLHEAEKAAGNFNQQVAVGMTKVLSAMPTFWIVAIFIVGWIVLQSTAYAWDKLPYPLLLTVLNLPQISMMIALGVGQGVLGRHAELQSEEQFNTTMSTYHDIEQITQHLSAQDGELLRHTKILIHLLEKNGISLQQLEAEVGHTSHLETYTEQPVENTAPVTPAAVEDEKKSS
jgi:uncharacterized membrane protein